MQAKLAISQDKAGYELANGLKGKEKLPPSDSFLSSLFFFLFACIFSLSGEPRTDIDYGRYIVTLSREIALNLLNSKPQKKTSSHSD